MPVAPFAGAAFLGIGLLWASSLGSRLGVMGGLVLQLATGFFWEGAPAPVDRQGTFRVVMDRQTGLGKGECEVLSGPDPALQGRRVRCSEGRLGDTLSGEGVLKGLREATNPGGFEARDWGASAGLEGFLTWKEPGPAKVHGMTDFGEGVRRRIDVLVTTILRRRLDPASAAMWTATLLAKNNALPTPALEAFRQSGLFHMLSVSGFHIAVLGGGLVLLLSLVRVPRRVAWIAAALVVVAYSWLLQFPPPVTRSMVAFVALALAMVLGRRPHLGNSLFLAAALILCLDPNTPFQMGAQLTFLATAALLWVAPALTNLFPLRWQRGKVHDWILAPLCASTAATLATAVVLAWHVGTVAWIGIPAGLVSATAFAVGFLAALATVMLGGLPAWVSWGFAGAAEGCARLVYVVALHAGQWAWGALVVGRPDPVVVCEVLAMVVLLGLTNRSQIATKVWVILVGAGLALGWHLSRPNQHRLELVFLDVGQGNATLVKWPSGRNWLIDAGPGSRTEEGRDAGRDAILPAMRILGMDRLDAVVISHADFDHFGGLGWLSHRVRPTRLFLASDSGTPASSQFDSVRASLVSRGWTVQKWTAGQTLTYGDGARCEVLAPAFGTNVPRNQASLVLRLGFDSCRALIPGDADSVSESFQIASGLPLASQVLLVGHHGSKHSSSSDWLRLVRPTQAILSYGKTNRYGHPHPEVLARLDSVGARLWRTPEGAVRVELGERGVRVETPHGSWWRGPWRKRDLSLHLPWI